MVRSAAPAPPRYEGLVTSYLSGDEAEIPDMDAGAALASARHGHARDDHARAPAVALCQVHPLPRGRPTVRTVRIVRTSRPFGRASVGLGEACGARQAWSFPQVWQRASLHDLVLLEVMQHAWRGARRACTPLARWPCACSRRRSLSGAGTNLIEKAHESHRKSKFPSMQ